MFLKVFMLIRQGHPKYIICHYWYFLDKEYKFQSLFCNGDNINNLSCIT